MFKSLTILFVLFVFFNCVLTTVHAQQPFNLGESLFLSESGSPQDRDNDGLKDNLE